MACCGGRDEDKVPVTPREALAGENGSKAETAAEEKIKKEGLGTNFGRLIVKVVKAEGLLGMDFGGLDASSIFRRGNGSVKLIATLDAYVEVKINDEPAFGTTNVVWKTKGDPTWDESFNTLVKHPQSYLCVTVCDDDEVFSKDSAVALHRQAGFIEIPLWQMPVNKTVTGWVNLHHPNTVDPVRAGILEIVQKEAAMAHAEFGDAEVRPVETVPKDAAGKDVRAGRVKLELFLESTKQREIAARLSPAPEYQTTPPPLDLPQFVQDVKELKTLGLDRLVKPPIQALMLALSWKKMPLSIGVLCWWWLMYLFPEYIYTSILCFVGLCFWHPPETKTPSSDSGKPANGKKSAADAFGDLGLQELQSALFMLPGLKMALWEQQQTVSEAHRSVTQVEALIYWAKPEITDKVVKLVGLVAVLSLLVGRYLPTPFTILGSCSGLVFASLGTVVIMVQCPGLTFFLTYAAAVALTLARPQTPFSGCVWFQKE